MFRLRYVVIVRLCIRKCNTYVAAFTLGVMKAVYRLTAFLLLRMYV